MPFPSSAFSTSRGWSRQSTQGIVQSVGIVVVLIVTGASIPRFRCPVFAAAPVPSTSSTSSSLGAGQIAGIVVGCVVGVALLLALVAYLVYRSTKKAYPAPPWTQEDEELLKSLITIKQVTRFSVKQLSDATDSFSEKTLLGEGGYGWVSDRDASALLVSTPTQILP